MKTNLHDTKPQKLKIWIVKREHAQIKQELIQTINALFPIDSQYDSTNETGKTLLIQAILNTNWRDLPLHILREYANLCEQEENRQARKFEQKYKDR